MVKENMDETNSGYAKQVGGLKGKKIDSATFEYETQVKEILNTAGMAHICRYWNGKCSTPIS